MPLSLSRQWWAFVRVYTRALAYLLTKRVFHSVIKRCKAGLRCARSHETFDRADGLYCFCYFLAAFSTLYIFSNKYNYVRVKVIIWKYWIKTRNLETFPFLSSIPLEKIISLKIAMELIVSDWYICVYSRDKVAINQLHIYTSIIFK